MKLEGHVARIEEKRNPYRLQVGKPEGKRPLGSPRHKWGIILTWILERYDRVVWTGFIWFRIGTGEYCDEPFGAIKCWEALE
jgi:hypothetical protein